MLFDEIIKYCDESYKSQLSSGQCCLCTHDSQNCPANCEICLEQVHYPSRYAGKGRHDYNCERIVNYYVCKYVDKYSSEILYALNSQDYLSNYEYFNILSIGCGSAPDLIAIENYNNYHKNVSIRYKGYEINKKWTPIHECVKEYCDSKGIKTEFYYEDVRKHFKGKGLKGVNLLILQYFISHFFNAGKRREFFEFFSDLTQNVISKMAKDSTIIINDTNHWALGRDDFLDLATIIENNGIRIIQKEQKYFDYNISDTRQRYGNKYHSKESLFGTPSLIKENYNSWDKCSSVQLIMRIEGA